MDGTSWQWFNRLGGDGKGMDPLSQVLHEAQRQTGVYRGDGVCLWDEGCGLIYSSISGN